jgi:hypothetical protein
VILGGGRAGTAETVSLDKDHGLRISIRAIPGAGRFRQSSPRKSKFKRGMIVLKAAPPPERAPILLTAAPPISIIHS